ncbi:hypothetical protein CVV68_21130 [Arthrobacter livingstonensis]|uniref:Proteinase inhibitor I42 chagasin domain-containing protein n=1 Tax=Arthrobacter livingstonensis TaxID=670078 RepID=A0A2V5L0V9_9MICC|nr:protease inhibitor I42 family protein [Arthrobacter livingstonensis]PYI64725.1 hypothetical protein CVV68_21130 [Arthrobacter livingstonensis]
MITVHTGETFAVELPATPATGYQWQATGVPAGMEATAGSFQPDARDARAVPAAGRQVFHFKAGAPGTLELHFELKRSWETEPARRHTEEVLVLPQQGLTSGA